ncbi:hypothetical protein CSOJ01_03769 [Colletotrichum sojae]|uniref:Uncharacterized protein n=1 Tax=Colletotrichum sojae TaxID=2175907 RepID=A0A8H6MZM9_9PEZI|nr:hypothetical protein CSOJ01_03769 [Colletotrichum sojae]
MAKARVSLIPRLPRRDGKAPDPRLGPFMFTRGKGASLRHLTQLTNTRASRTPFFSCKLTAVSLDHPFDIRRRDPPGPANCPFPSSISEKLQQAILHLTSPGLTTTTLTRLDALETPDEGTSTNRSNWENRNRIDRETHWFKTRSRPQSNNITTTHAQKGPEQQQQLPRRDLRNRQPQNGIQPKPNNTQVPPRLRLRKKTNHINKRFRRSHTSFKMVVQEITSFSNMGRGAYDTTGVPKPPPRPKPR